MKKYRFYFHWNKIEHKWSIHFRKKCYIVDDFMYDGKIETKQNKRQPHAVIQGFARDVQVINNPLAHCMKKPIYTTAFIIS